MRGLIILAGCWLAALPAIAADPKTFKDCADCPEMLVVPAGSFTMGAPDDEPDRQRWDGPLTKVTIAKPFALGKFEVTRGQFAKFVKATKRPVGSNCRNFTGK